MEKGILQSSRRSYSTAIPAGLPPCLLEEGSAPQIKPRAYLIKNIQPNQPVFIIVVCLLGGRCVRSRDKPK